MRAEMVTKETEAQVKTKETKDTKIRQKKKWAEVYKSLWAEMCPPSIYVNPNPHYLRM